MKLPQALPSSLLALLALLIPQSYQQESWHIETQETDLLSPHDAEIYQKLQTQAPISLRKMNSHDPGEMFYLSDWHFDDTGDAVVANSTTSLLDLPILLHSSASHHQPFLRPLSRFLRPRDSSGFSCPSNTNSCASIGANYGCCPQGTTCQIDSKGSLGCCPGSAGTCTGSTPTNCEDGYTPCSLFHGGGGCCAQGFQCQSQGCVGVSTTVVVVYPTVTATSSSLSSISASTTTTTISSTSTTSTTSSSASSTSTSTTTISTSTSTPTTETTTETSLSIPIIATSLSITTSTSSQPTTIYIGPCPTGYYACSAVFALGSCCQIGRDCGRTSCPPLITSTALVSNGVTIADVSASGLCATGWTTCAAGVGGGCCPSGYGCGTQVCSATATATAQASLGSVVAKEGSTSAASASAVTGGRIGVRLFGLVGTVVLLLSFVL